MSDIYLATRDRQDLILSYVQDILNVVSGNDDLAKSRIAANYFRTRASRYASLEFGCSWPSWETSHLSEGTRTKNAVNMVAYPSTDETAARNDFDNYFYGMIVNGHVRADGEFVIDYFDSDAEFNRYTRDTYALFPPMYFKYDFTNGEEIALCLSQKTGYAPVGPAIKSDGSIRDFIPIAVYGASLDGEGVPMSVSDALIVYGVSHNNQITTWKKKGTQYAMETIQEYEFLNLLFMVTFATRNTQSVMAGCTSYNFTYTLAAAETGVKRAVITNAQAANLVVGSTVSIGSTDDRTKATSYDVVNRKKIARIEDIGNGKSAIYLDTEDTFDTSTSLHITTFPWYSGKTDGVLGTCGSPGSNQNGVYPYRLYGVECAWGQYVCMSNVVYKVTNGIGKMYIAYDATNASSSAPTNNYTEVNSVVAGIGGKNGYISERGYDSANPFVRFPTADGKEATSSTGYADNTYGMNNNTESTNAVREFLVGGSLAAGANAGRFYVAVHHALAVAGWGVAARLSALADCGRAAA